MEGFVFPKKTNNFKTYHSNNFLPFIFNNNVILKLISGAGVEFVKVRNIEILVFFL